MSDWADEKAREWVGREIGQVGDVDSLAALLREVKGEPPDQFGACDRCHDRNISVLLCPKCDGRVVGLAEVRRVVEEVLSDRWPADVFTPPPKGQHGGTVDACSAAALRAVVPGLRDEILSRMEKL